VRVQMVPLPRNPRVVAGASAQAAAVSEQGRLVHGTRGKKTGARDSRGGAGVGVALLGKNGQEKRVVGGSSEKIASWKTNRDDVTLWLEKKIVSTAAPGGLREGVRGVDRGERAWLLGLGDAHGGGGGCIVESALGCGAVGPRARGEGWGRKWLGRDW
jgi:hypothetical protein